MVVIHKQFFVGDEHTGLRHDRIDWVKETFDEGSYWFVDEGYFHYERYVRFLNEVDAVLYRMRWE